MELKFQEDGRKIVLRRMSKEGSYSATCKMMHKIYDHGKEIEYKQKDEINFQNFDNPLFDMDVELAFPNPLFKMHIDSMGEEQLSYNDFLPMVVHVGLNHYDMGFDLVDLTQGEDYYGDLEDDGCVETSSITKLYVMMFT